MGSDNIGLEGIEMVYNEQLQGVPGRIVSANKTAGLEMPDNYEAYDEPQDGNSVVLTIDETMQHIAEKHLENVVVINVDILVTFLVFCDTLRDIASLLMRFADVLEHVCVLFSIH